MRGSNPVGLASSIPPGARDAQDYTAQEKSSRGPTCSAREPARLGEKVQPSSRLFSLADKQCRRRAGARAEIQHPCGA
jgi:hypothetical protein